MAEYQQVFLESEEDNLLPKKTASKKSLFVTHSIQHHKESLIDEQECCGHLRYEIAQLIEGPRIQIMLLVLIILDLLCLAAQMVMEGFRICDPDSDKLIFPNHIMEILEEVFHWTSVAVLVVFAIELMFLVFAYGHHIFKKPFYIVDIVVVTASLVFDILFLGYEVVEGIVLIIWRGWRLVRIGHGFYVGLEENFERHKEGLLKKIDELKQQQEKSQNEIKQLIEKLNKKKKVIADFKHEATTKAQIQ